MTCIPAAGSIMCDYCQHVPCCRHEPISGPVVEEVEKDNSTLLDLNVHNQGLTAKDIAEMAASGKVGPGISSWNGLAVSRVLEHNVEHSVIQTLVSPCQLQCQSKGFVQQ